jgi:hypothetical protein
LSILNEKGILNLIDVNPLQHFTEPPPRYSEASLVKKMEELGIGRPSTYATIISVLQDRGYVKLDKKRFFPEERGRIVVTFLKEFFAKYVEFGYTASLEDELDTISNGEMDWKIFLKKFWNDFNGNIVQDTILDYTGLSFFPGETTLSGTQIFLDLRYGLVQKIGVIGNTTIKFTNWPDFTTQARYHKLILMVKFNMPLSDVNRFNYKLKFTTELGGIIKASNNLDYEVINNKPSWFLKPSIDFGRTTTVYNIDENKLPTPITSTALTIPVTSTDSFPDSGTLLIDDEQIKYTSKTATSFVVNVANGGSRGANSTIASVHQNNSVVKQLLTDDMGDYEHVFEIWSYDKGNTVFIDYVNKFLGK